MNPSPVRHVSECLGLLALVAAVSSLAAAPRVVRASPDNGARDVDPSLKEFRVVFDQPMAAGFSLVGGGPTQPAYIGRPRWVDERTLVAAW